MIFFLKMAIWKKVKKSYGRVHWKIGKTCHTFGRCLMLSTSWSRSLYFANITSFIGGKGNRHSNFPKNPSKWITKIKERWKAIDACKIYILYK